VGVQAEEPREAGLLFALEVRGVLQPEEPGPLEGRLLRLPELPPLQLGNRVHRVDRVPRP
jgi:hypothetical protein